MNLRKSTRVTHSARAGTVSQFGPEGWYRSLYDAVIAESILNRIVSNAELVQLDGPNMCRHIHTESTR